MVLGFKNQFRDKILAGSKIHTVRQDPNNRWRPGNVIHFATGVRTSNYKQFMEGRCTAIQFVTMDYYGYLRIHIDQRLLTQDEGIEFAKRDGFENFLDFETWFGPLIKASPDRVYRAKIVHWTEYKYEAVQPRRLLDNIGHPWDHITGD